MQLTIRCNANTAARATGDGLGLGQVLQQALATPATNILASCRKPSKYPSPISRLAVPPSLEPADEGLDEHTFEGCGEQDLSLQYLLTPVLIRSTLRKT